MRSRTKLPLALARKALGVAQAALPAYRSNYSPRKYPPQQLFALLVLRQFFQTDYRGIGQYLPDLPDLRRVLSLKQVPFCTTLCPAERRLLKKRTSLLRLRSVFDRLADRGLSEGRPEAAVEATGLESRHLSAYSIFRNHLQLLTRPNCL